MNLDDLEKKALSVEVDFEQSDAAAEYVLTVDWVKSLSSEWDKRETRMWGFINNLSESACEKLEYLTDAMPIILMGVDKDAQ